MVRRGSLGYYAALGRAVAWVDDGRFPPDAAKRQGTVYVNAGAGTPVRKVGFDTDAMKRATALERWLLRKEIDRWDAVVVRAPYDADVMRASWRTRARMLRVGYPRNDALVTGGDPTVVRDLRARLGIGADADVVLHVPSCGAAVVAPAPELLRPGQVLVVRPGEAPDVQVPAGAVDATDVDDLTALLLLADVLVTDHDPVLFDMPLRRRPVVVVGCRCGVRGGRGTEPDASLDLDAEAPGPVVWDADGLRDALADLDALAAATRDDLDRAVKTYAAYETGAAAAQVVDALLERLSMAGSARRPRAAGRRP
jgi:CDP-glycerol glycerophosphotransferase